MLKEFRDFISRGNMIDLAVGVIIGGAFTSLVKSLTTNLISPLLSLFMGKSNLDSIYFTLLSAKFTVGTFISDVINFIIMAFVVFILVKIINRVTHRAEPAPAAPSPEETYLKEIRDLLQAQKQSNQ
ncbi:large conductance mechanosensitive channel protein [Lacticaseibacillus pantheris DSM 15945 = JCM 12539 = NBRC 106106]|jgi:large conductance mechanosensitive channel|uniref:Large-conductance mechanosensitive channel n=1 Tax=Lacticaseibacillus pantheris DSM 15945 = JCM 12539 = NBRC 106106 TaxID=1423783 RepID=A0A0R1TXV8_9LACO|nr:large conductance mechanosensitive channel protein MscL [Lacticaseibacillus pantheris]KRL86049.1 large conductance mechanosensitive channel protein [Lacticaseibacillus pantheris DSM 15945 = JCM 12539 = NBRC 106106]